MANKALYGEKEFRVPENVIHDIKLALRRYPDASGHERAQHLVTNPVISYANAKRIKSFLDVNTNAGTPSYALCGGKLMLGFLDGALAAERNSVIRTKTVKSNAGFSNQFISPHEKSFLKQSIPRASDLKLPKVKRMELFEQATLDNATFCLAIVINSNNKILLAKRANDDDWMPGKWALLGGGIEPGEDPATAVVRELREEANLELVNLELCGPITEPDGKTGLVFIAQCENEGEIRLNPEHSDFVWISPSKIGVLGGVPGLVQTVRTALGMAVENKQAAD